jgi:serine protease AprX
MRLLLFLVLVTTSVGAQQVYWVEFLHKDSSFQVAHPQQFLSRQAIERRQKFKIPVDETDLPVSPVFLETLRQKGYVILCSSKWLNAATVVLTDKKEEEAVKQLPFVKMIRSLGRYDPPVATRRYLIDPDEIEKAADSMDYGKSENQVSMLHTQQLHQLGLKGEGVNIALIDAGFNNADTLPAFNRLRNDNRVKVSYDFVQHNNNVYEDDDHGLAVLSCMAGYLPGEYIGTAPMANYYLLRSEYALTEMPVEEAYWIAAIEYADSAGVDLVNSSLGYNEFDNIAFNYTHKDLDGKTALISRAASIAVQKGVVVVISAGNEGDEDWKYISVPADVAEVITVGGVKADLKLVGFSSVGPGINKHVKPDIMAQADNVWVASPRGAFYQGDGTSYASPLMAGSIACLMQAYPDVLPSQLMAVLHTSSSQYNKPDQYYGYGVPDLYLAYLMLQSDVTDAILDTRILNDNRIHLTYRASGPQKAEVSITNEKGEEVLHENVSFKEKGVSRFALKKIKHFKKGTYHLQFRSNEVVKTVDLNYE